MQSNFWRYLHNKNLKLRVAETIFWNFWFSQDGCGWTYFASISYPFPSLLYWYTVSLVRRTQYSYTCKHSKTLELTGKHDKHVLQLTANCN